MSVGRRRPTRLLVIIALLVLVQIGSACGGQAVSAPGPSGTPDPTAEVSAAATPDAPSSAPSPTPLATGEIPTSLVGTWTFEVFGKPASIELTADGRFTMQYTEVPGRVSGSFGVFGDEIVWRDEVGDVCYPVESRYGWHLEDDRLVLTVIDDDCTSGRVAEWTAGWTRSGE